MAEIVGVVGVAIGFVALLHSIYKTRDLGPEIDIIDARVIERKKDQFRIMLLIQNTGDRMGFIRWETIKIQVGDQEFISKHPATWEWDTQADRQTRIAFTFFIGDIDLTGGEFVAEGEYSYKGKMLPRTYRYPLKGQLKPVSQLEDS